MVASTITGAVTALEGEIGLPPGFFKKIGAEDDWTFIVKLHALIERCVTKLIVDRTKSLGLHKILERLRFNDTKAGKLAVARDLGLLSAEYIDFIRVVCEIRNDFVHDVNFLSVPLSEYIRKCPNGTALAKKVCRLMNVEAHIEGAVLLATDLFDQHPKIALEIAAMDLLADLHLGHERVRLAMNREDLTQQAFSLLCARRDLDSRIQLMEHYLHENQRCEEGS
jgi:hypothetical protein